MSVDAPPVSVLGPAPGGDRRGGRFGLASDVLAGAGAVLVLYAVAGAPPLGPIRPNQASPPVRGIFVAALVALVLVVGFCSAGRGRRTQVRSILIALGALSVISLAGDPRYAAILVLLLVGLEAARDGALGTRGREQAAGAFLLGIGTVLLDVPTSSAAHALGVLGIVLGLVAVAGLFPMVRRLNVREGDVGWLALVSPVLVLVVVSQILGILGPLAVIVFSALTISFGVLNLAWGVVGAWRARDDLVAWRFLFLADWGLAFVGLGVIVPDGSGMQGAFLILIQILVVRFPLHELAQARVALGQPRRSRSLAVVAGAVLCGLPPFAGFAARFYLLRAAIELGSLPTIVLMLAVTLWALIGLRLGRALGVPRGRAAFGVGTVVVIALFLGVAPWLVLQTVGLP